MVIGTIDSMHSQHGYGHIEIKLLDNQWWALYVNGDLKKQSADHDYIRREYEKLG